MCHVGNDQLPAISEELRGSLAELRRRSGIEFAGEHQDRNIGSDRLVVIRRDYSARPLLTSPHVRSCPVVAHKGVARFAHDLFLGYRRGAFRACNGQIHPGDGLNSRGGYRQSGIPKAHKSETFPVLETLAMNGGAYFAITRFMRGNALTNASAISLP